MIKKFILWLYYMITWSLIWEFAHCKRQGWLYYYNIRTEHLDENVRIWKFLHELKYKEEDIIRVNEYSIKLDKLICKDWNYLIYEYKKSSKTLESALYQVLFYIYIFKLINNDDVIWVILFEEDNQENKDLDFDMIYKRGKIYIKLTEKNENKLINLIEELKSTLLNKYPPVVNKSDKCKWCSFYLFCWS